MSEKEDVQWREVAAGLAVGTCVVLLFGAWFAMWTADRDSPAPATVVAAPPAVQMPDPPDPLAELEAAGGSMVVYFEGGGSVATVSVGGVVHTRHAGDPVEAARLALEQWRNTMVKDN